MERLAFGNWHVIIEFCSKAAAKEQRPTICFFKLRFAPFLSGVTPVHSSHRVRLNSSKNIFSSDHSRKGRGSPRTRIEGENRSKELTNSETSGMFFFAGLNSGMQSMSLKRGLSRSVLQRMLRTASIYNWVILSTFIIKL